MNIVSFSGGKDSTAMLLMMIERGMPVDDIIFCDTGMEFPEMYDHIDKVEAYIEKPVTRLRYTQSFEYLLGEFKKKSGKIGYGWPDFRNRWCTAYLKRGIFKKYINKLDHVIEYHGIAKDEEHRTEKNKTTGRNIVYPLVDWGITEKEALDYCYDHGFDWGGLYQQFDRVSCWCCPLSRIGELRTLYVNYPDLWKRLQELDKKSYRSFRSNCTVDQLTDRFRKEQENNSNKGGKEPRNATNSPSDSTPKNKPWKRSGFCPLESRSKRQRSSIGCR